MREFQRIGWRLTAIALFAIVSAPAAADVARKPSKGDHHGHYPGNRTTPDVEAYIRMLGRKSRDAWQHPDAVVAALRLRPNDTIADIGAGGGYFTFRFARQVTRGTVYAVEIEPKMLRHIEREAKRLKLTNIRSVLSTGSDPRLPRPVRWAFMCNVLHHVDHPRTFLRNLAKSIVPGGRFVVLEYIMGKLPTGPPDRIKIPKKRIIAMAKAAGFRLERELPTIVRYQHVLIFRKPRRVKGK
ncbi:MAG: methyltransferase [Myxococcales bacterium]|nr:methyltransferase [Myxococcales bacterium]